MQTKMRVSLDSLKDRFNSMLESRGYTRRINEFDRDSIVFCIEASLLVINPPFPGLLPDADTAKLKKHYNRWFSDFSNPGCELESLEREELANSFVRYLKVKGYQEYLVFSEGFWDDPDGETIKAYCNSVKYDFKVFFSEADELIDIVNADTILMSPDMTRILVLFHHEVYELFDESFGQEFLDYVLTDRADIT